LKREKLILLKIRRKKDTSEIQLCPKCMKPTLRNAFNVSGWLSNPVYKCSNCGYTGAFYFAYDSKENGENSDESKTSDLQTDLK
jgi:predicted RNA-binding Zn-ribbon protein involved in translation (DUF1610 family)